MKRILVLSAALMLVAGAALAQGTLYEHQNEIGVYFDPAPPADVPAEMLNYSGIPGQITAYVVLTNPWNLHYGSPTSTVQQPISVVGGFEFRVVLPANVFLLAAAMPPMSTNFATQPDYLAGTNAPVTDNHVTLLTMTLGEFSGAPSEIYLSPVQEAPQSIPGMMAITDYNDDFRLNPAYPSSGSYDAPVAGLWLTEVVDTEDASFGAVKSMYR